MLKGKLETAVAAQKVALGVSTKNISALYGIVQVRGRLFIALFADEVVQCADAAQGEFVQ